MKNGPAQSGRGRVDFQLFFNGLLFHFRHDEKTAIIAVSKAVNVSVLKLSHRRTPFLEEL